MHLKCLRLISIFVLISAFGGCGEDINISERSKGVVKQVLQQNPGPNDVLMWSDKFSFYEKDITITSDEDYLRIEDHKKDKVGWALWVLENVTANQNYNITIKINKGHNKGQYSQIQVKFLVKKILSAKYFYLFMPKKGKVIAQQQATQDMATVIDKGDYWLVKLQAESPEISSSMQFMILPAVGKKSPVGSLEIQAIEIAKK